MTNNPLGVLASANATPATLDALSLNRSRGIGRGFSSTFTLSILFEVFEYLVWTSLVKNVLGKGVVTADIPKTLSPDISNNNSVTILESSVNSTSS